jgi:hypothetical protein
MWIEVDDKNMKTKEDISVGMKMALIACLILMAAAIVIIHVTLHGGVKIGKRRERLK